MTKNAHGGSREGSGRPPKYGEDRELILIGFPKTLLDKIRVRSKEHDQSVSETVVRLIEDAIGD